MIFLCGTYDHITTEGGYEAGTLCTLIVCLGRLLMEVLITSIWWLVCRHPKPPLQNCNFSLLQIQL